MKKILSVTFALIFFASWSFAAPFSPTPLELSVQEWITYAFDGSEVDIPVEISGKPAKCWLIINTRMPEDQLPHQVTNGYLGWHYVNRIDTTVYISGAYNFAPGSHTIIWDGYCTENTSGGYGGTYEKFDPVAPGTYDYYVWGYDDQSPRERACNFLPISFYWQPQYTTFGEYDEAGLPRPNPLIRGNIPWMYDNLHGVGPPCWTAFKLELGYDPDDISKLQTTFMPGFSEEDQYDASPISFDPFDQNYFYNFHVYTEQKIGALFKWHWVGEGNAEIVNGWGGWDDLAFPTASRRGMGEYMEAVRNDGKYIYIASPGRNPYEIQHDWLWIVDFYGGNVWRQMLDDFYTRYFWDLYTNGTVNRMFASREFPYQVIMGGEQHCMMEMVDASRLIADKGDDEYVMWKNENGDYFLDASWNPEIPTHRWRCNTGEYNNENMGRHNELFFDSEGIVIAFADYQGLYSFVVCTQDGSGVAYCKFADDTDASNTNRKGSGQRVDIGSQFDGLYIGDVVSDELNYGATTQHINWVGFDSAHGVISAGYPPQEFLLTMAVNQAGWGTTNPSVGEHEYYEDTVVNITAIPSSGYRFVSWTGNVEDTNSAFTTVTMNGNNTVTANFEVMPQYTLTMAVNQTGWGTTNPSIGDNVCYENTVVNITAIPASGYRFVYWTGDVTDTDNASTTVNMNGNKTVTANFGVSTQYLLTMAVNQAGWGTTDPPVGYHNYDENTVVTISATPASGFRFVGWTGDVADFTNASTTAYMNSDKTVTAHFTEFFPAYWSPTPLEISVQYYIDVWNESYVEIPVDISGKPARCWLIINTRMPEDQLPHQVTNGYLGWHYVNRIDTTVYISGAYNFAPGSHTIIWDGCGTENTSGGYGGTYEKSDPVPRGTYDYYVWGYDNQSPRERTCNFLPISFYWQPQYTTFGEYDEAGLPRPNPLIRGNIPWMYDNLHGVGPPRWTAFKLPLGTDPDDVSKLQTTFMPGFSEEDLYDASPISFDPFDQNYFYNFHVYTAQKKGALHKWKWVGDGNAEIVAGWDDLAFLTASRSGMGEYMPAVTNDSRYIFIASPGRNPYEIQHDVLYIVDFDGRKIIDGQMLDDFYTPYAWTTFPNGQINRMFASREFPYQIIMGGELHCMVEMVDASRLAADEGDDEYVMWKNENGDYFLDANWDPEISTPRWACNTGGKYYNENMVSHNEQFWDSEGVVIAFVDYQGLYSFVVCTQDGSGVAYCKFADDTDSSNTNRKGSGQRVDIGGAYDGLYIGDVVSNELNYGATTQHINWVAFDSAHGVIDIYKQVAVKEEGQAAFSVDAAYPNPANPTTTIGFTLAKANHVTVDIYNIAGQKVDTLVDDEMSAGKHSVVWDGSGFSAGVYFYTVKSGKFSKTMKVTLLK